MEPICENRKAYRLLVGNPEGRRLLGRPKRGWVNNIKMNVGEIRMMVVWTGLIWFRMWTSGGLL
jgi:hypothetical protein